MAVSACPAFSNNHVCLLTDRCYIAPSIFHPTFRRGTFMAKAQGKKPAARGKEAAKKVAVRVKKAVKTVAKKATPKKAAAPKKAAPPKKAAAKKPVKPAKQVKKAAVKVKKAAAKVVKKVVKAAPKAVAKVAPKTAAKIAAPKAAPKPAGKPISISKPTAVPPPVKPAAPVAPNVPEPEKKRGRRARTRITSSGAPAAAWLSTEKPRPASFIPAPPRAEAPSAIAAPPASSDRLLRPEDTINLIAVRTVPVRIDIEQGAGRFYVMAYPLEVTLKVGEGIEWDFRYIGGADVTADEVIIEFDRPSPFPQTVYRTRKPGGARPHRQLSGGAVAAAAGKRVEYNVRAMNVFKTEMASTKIWVNITA